MAEVEVTVIEEDVEEKDSYAFVDMTRKILLAGVGAMALAQEEAEAFINKLVERGELAEKEGRQLVKDMVERRKQKMEEVAEDAESDLDLRVERVLQRMNIPTRNDINSLSHQIQILTRKVDELKESQS